MGIYGKIFEIRSIKMKLLPLFFCFSYENFISKQESNQFLATRSKCGDDCAKNKDKCHRFCESVSGDHKYCDCSCVRENAKCLCKDCNYEDRCPEYKERKRECPKLYFFDKIF